MSGTNLHRALLTCALAMGAATGLPAQAVQAVAHQRVKGAITLDSATKVLVDAWERFTALSRAATDTGARVYRECADSVAGAAKRALLATGDLRGFQAAWEEFLAAHRAYYRRCEDAGNAPPLRQQARAPAPVSPQAFDLVPAVVFTAGWALTDGTDMTTQHSFAVSTNLLGAAVGDLFQAIGAPDMKDYLSKNVAVGTSFPAGEGGRLSGFVQLGLGEMRLPLPILGRAVALWPALAVEQLDVADRRTPATLVTLDTTRQAWTAPVLSLGMTFWSGQKLRERIERAELTPIVSFGLMLPYYFPGGREPRGARDGAAREVRTGRPRTFQCRGRCAAAPAGDKVRGGIA